MKRKEIELFSLSFLDLLFGALGSVIFLFIVIPKGGAPPDPEKAIPVVLDMKAGKLFGDFAQQYPDIRMGDTLKVYATSIGSFPKPGTPCPPPVDCPPCPPQKPCPEIAKPITTTKPADKPVTNPSENQLLKLRPGVACRFSIELVWDNLKNNVDLTVCKSGECVSGGKRSNKSIGTWDSGKSINSWQELFKGKKDYRNNSEAVRQLDAVIPGTYEIYAKFKESSVGESNIEVRGLIYSELDGINPQVEYISASLSLDSNSKNKGKLMGTVIISTDGTFSFR